MVFETSPWEGSKKKLYQERRLIQEKRKQPGVSFPSAAKQEHLFIVRIDLRSEAIYDVEVTRKGLKDLCNFMREIDRDIVKLEELADDGSVHMYPLSRYNFTFTIGFGHGFFEKLKINREKCPSGLYPMPNHYELADEHPYVLEQSDIILQLGSTKDFVNRWVFQNDIYQRVLKNDQEEYRLEHDIQAEKSPAIHDIESAVNRWAVITDTHSGFQRMDGRNLMGFNDGISNPDRLNNEVVWIPSNNENERYADGTYMVFQKIEHDLEMWRKLDVTQQEKWVGRSKGTGLLLGTLSRKEDQKLACECFSADPQIQNAARNKLKELLREQMDPDKEFFKEDNPAYENIRRECPVWSHVRKSNPRGSGKSPKKVIYRRGYLFMTDNQEGQTSSGLLFICFQRDIRNGFEYIKKNFLNNKNFPVINIGKEGLAGPSNTGGKGFKEFSATRVLGGGYYFVPPIPNKDIGDVVEQFF